MKNNAQNERIKRRYFDYLKEAKRQSQTSIDTAASALDFFDSLNRHRDFSKFHIKQATAFKEKIAAQTSEKTKRPLSKATQLHMLAALRAFFIWLADQPGFRQKIRYSDADYFSLSLKDTAIAKAQRDIQGPTIEQVRHVVNTMPHGTDIEKRNRALIAFALLSGARDNALASLKLKHIDLAKNELTQDAREVRTKASKTIVSWLFPAGDDFFQIVKEWVHFLKEQKQWGLDDALFPKTRIEVGNSRHFEAVGLERGCWSTAAPIRKIFKQDFEKAGLPYFNPHSFRKTLTRLGEEICGTPEEFKAWSQNLGHDNVLTTFTSYGQVARHRQQEIMENLRRPNI
jgi:integrase/recombinase XerD